MAFCQLNYSRSASLDQVSQNQVLTRKGGTSLMQKPGSTSKKSDANAFNSLEGSRIGLASETDSKTHPSSAGRERAKARPALPPTHIWTFPPRSVRRLIEFPPIARHPETESRGPIWLGVSR